MKVRKTTYIGWLLGSMLMLLLTACSESEERADEKEPTVISIYVYAPEKPMPTRAGENQISGSEAESDIHSLQIWVFTHETTPQLVGYLEPKVMPTAEGTVYQMAVSDDFAETKPNVDVYVAANTSAVGLSFGMTSTRAELQAAMFGASGVTDYFGVPSPTTTVSPTAGLPMSGVLLNQPVVGDSPVLRIGTDDFDGMAKVQLLRAVSKVRFAFCQQLSDEAKQLKITGISLAGRVESMDYGFPTQEYLFLDGASPYRIGSDYVADGVTLLAAPEALNVPTCLDPSVYIYHDQSAQDYEDLIDAGVTKDTPELVQAGPFYFRETDKKLQGTITYQIGEEAPKSKPFYMTMENGFSRNHSWIVLAYYGSDGLDVVTVYVKPWATGSTSDRPLHNW